VNRIRENLWITDISTVQNTSFDADVVISVCQDTAADNVGCLYEHFNMADGETDGWGGRNDYDIFRDAVDTVIEHVRAGQKTIVHCHRGHSRSAAVCISAAAILDENGYRNAFNAVRRVRVIGPDELLVEYANRYITENSVCGAETR